MKICVGDLNSRSQEREVVGIKNAYICTSYREGMKFFVTT
jgi:hypothetical protein